MDEHARLRQQAEHQRLLGLDRGHLDDGRPAASGSSSDVAGRVRRRSRSATRFRAHGRGSLLANRRPRGDERGAASCTGVDTDRYVSQMTLEPIERLGNKRVRAADRDPAELHLRQARRLRQAAQRERQRRVIAGERNSVRARRERIVREHFVDDERDAAAAALARQPRRDRRARSIDPVGLLGLTTSTARVRGVSASVDALAIDRPVVVLRQPVRPERDARRARSADRTADSSAAARARRRPDRTAA